MIPQIMRGIYNDTMQSEKFLSGLIRWMVPLAAAFIFSAWIIISPPGLLGKADSIGYAVCHRISERSFHTHDGRALPLCARCSGMYLGAAVGLIFQGLIGWRRSGNPGWSVISILILFLIAFGIDGANSYLYLVKSVDARFDFIPTLYIPNNTLRLFTGSGMGLGIAAVLFPAFNQTVWKEQNNARAIPNLKTFAALAALMIVVDLLVLTESDWVLVPATFISAGAVLVLLTMIYSMVWLMIMRQENAFTSIMQMGMALLAGLTIALLQIGAIDAVRFWLTGTWGAFPL